MLEMKESFSYPPLGVLLTRIMHEAVGLYETIYKT